MGFYKYMAESPLCNKERLIEWRTEGAVVRTTRPVRLDRARRLGYKAKKGFVLLRVRIGKGGSKRERPNRGRKASKAGQVRYAVKQSQRWIAEQRAARKFTNLEVLNSYYLDEDGQHRWFEVIMVDPASPSIVADKNLQWILSKNGRVWRGLTGAGKRGRGLLWKGEGVEKVRPSIGAHDRKGK